MTSALFADSRETLARLYGELGRESAYFHAPAVVGVEGDVHWAMFFMEASQAEAAAQRLDATSLGTSQAFQEWMRDATP